MAEAVTSSEIAAGYYCSIYCDTVIVRFIAGLVDGHLSFSYPTLKDDSRLLRFGLSEICDYCQNKQINNTRYARFYGHILVLILNVGESAGMPPPPMALDARRLTQFKKNSYIHFYYM
jgi:hypothetical protein